MLGPPLVMRQEFSMSSRHSIWLSVMLDDRGKVNSVLKGYYIDGGTSQYSVE